MIKVATAISVILLIVSIAFVVLSFKYNASDHYISLNNTTHIGLLNQRANHWDRFIEAIIDPGIAFFSDDYGPYLGSIRGAYPEIREASFGDTWGIYYRFFEYGDGSTLWTLTVSLWYPIIAFSLLPIAGIFPLFSRSYTLKKLLLVTTIIAIALGSMQVTGLRHPFPIAVVFFGAVLCLLTRACFERLFGGILKS